MNETATLAKYAANLRYEDIPQAALDRARNTVCDTVGAIVFGFDLPWSQMIVDYATVMVRAAGAAFSVPAEVSFSPDGGAANGALAHAFELDGAAEPSAGTHPGAALFPALLALAQERGFGGRDLITAFVAATEVMLRIGTATRKSNEHRGFHAPATTGPFGAAVGAGRLLGFDASKMTNALGIAGSLSCGLVQFSRSGTGGMVKRLHFGRAAEGGVLAANLAERGFTGPHDILEGEFGFLRVFCDEFDLAKLTAGLGEVFMTMNIYMKRFACHGTGQAPLQGLQELQAKHRFSAADVERIDIGGSPDMVDRHNIPAPRDPMLAQYSVPFAVALGFFAIRRTRARSMTRLSPTRTSWSYVAASGFTRTTVSGFRRKRGDRFEGGTVLESGLQRSKARPYCPRQSGRTRSSRRSRATALRRRWLRLFERLQAMEAETGFDWLMA